MQFRLRAAGFCLLASMVASAGARAETDLKIGLTPILECMPLYYAVEAGHYRKAGYNVRIVNFRGGAEITAGMLGGSIDMAATTTDRAILLHSKGQLTKNVVQLTNHTLHVVLIRPDIDLAYGDLKGLKGKTAAVAALGGGLDLVLRFMLTKVGLEPDKDVKIRALGAGAPLLAGLETGQVDAINHNEPYVTQAVEVDKKGKILLDVAKDGPGPVSKMSYLALTATDEWLKVHREDAKKIIAAQRDADNEINADPMKAMPAALKYFEGMSPEVLAIVLKKHAPYWRPQITEDQIAAADEFQRGLGNTDKPVAYGDVVVDAELRALWNK